MGINNDTAFASAAAGNGKGHSQLSDIPTQEIKHMLETHFMWQYFHPGKCGSEFISWTSSLLWALQFAVRKTVNSENPKVVSDEHHIKLCVLDTSSLDTYVFLPAPGLIAKYDLLINTEARRRYHDDEYLVHGKLDVDGLADTVSLATLRAEGLFDLVPELDEEEDKPRLRRRILQWRTRLCNAPMPISPKDRGLALWIASLFGTGLTIPMLIALLSLRGRPLVDKSFLRVIRIFPGKLIEPTERTLPCKGADITTDSARTFRALYPHYRGSYTAAPEQFIFTDVMNEVYHEVNKTVNQTANDSSGLATELAHMGVGSELAEPPR